MIGKRVIAFVGYLAVSLLLLGFGARYYFGDELMPYHLVAMGVPWESLPESVRFLFREFMHGAGAGFLTTSLAMLVLLFVPFRRGERWAEWALPALGLSVNGLLSAMLCAVMTHTRAEPPIGLILASTGVIGISALLTLPRCLCRCRCAKED